jgi:hypothetical protein
VKVDVQKIIEEASPRDRRSRPKSVNFTDKDWRFINQAFQILGKRAGAELFRQGALAVLREAVAKKAEILD